MNLKKILVLIAATMLALSLPFAAVAQTEDPQIDDESAVTSQVQGDEEAPMIEDQATSEDIEAETNEEAGLEDSAEDEELPKTASPFALLALLGLLSAGFAIGVRNARQS